MTSDTTGTAKAPWGIINVIRAEYVGPTTGRKMFGMWKHRIESTEKNTQKI